MIPILLWAIIFILNEMQSSSDTFGMSEAEGMVMGEGDGQLTVFINRMVNNEIDTEIVRYIISLRTDDGNTAYEEKISMNYDMFGKGLVTAIQIDGDPELELLAWGNNVTESESFYLDLVDGVIEKKSFDNVPQNIKDYFNNDYGSTGGLIIIAGLLFLLTPVYYLVLIIIFFSRRSKRKKVSEVE